MLVLILATKLATRASPAAGFAQMAVSALVLALKLAGQGDVMAKDWDAVARAIQERMTDLDITQTELSQRAGVALMTVRELQHNLKPRRRNPRTLTAMSEALGWPAEHLAAVLAGQNPDDPDTGDPVLAELDALKEQLTAITRRLDALEAQQAAADAQP